jgi:regulator of RNase E activity RraA
MWIAKRGIAGLIVDCAIRDGGSVHKMSSPVDAARVNPRGRYRDGPGEINVPVSCGGIVVRLGDILVRDADGVVAIDPGEAPAILERAKAAVAKERGTHRRHQKQSMGSDVGRQGPKGGGLRIHPRLKRQQFSYSDHT